MIYDQILVRYGDLTLKGKNKKEFLQRVQSLTKNKLKGLNVEIIKTFDRIYIKLNDCDYKEVIKRLDRVSGLLSYSLVKKCESNLDDIITNANLLLQDIVKEKVTFKVESKRADKKFPLTSQEISKKVAAGVLKAQNNLKVDVHNPQLTLKVELRSDATYLYTNEYEGIGGFPVGVAGKGALMLSGGIDSPVAGFLAMKQGIEIECVHFESTPLTPIESAQKVVDLVKKMAWYAPNNKIKLHMVPFEELHQQILHHIPDSYKITIMRRMMYRICEQVAKRNNCLCMVNGESVGQVASQTLNSMFVINEVTNMPIIRPLATYDKNAIIKLSKKIDCFDISIRPHQDCCTVYVPKNPVTKPTLDKCIAFEKNFDYESLIKKTVDNVITLDIDVDSDLDLTMMGFEIKEIFKNN